MRARTVAAIAGFLAVGLGAFGAHALKGRLDATQADLWQKAVLYHLVHAVATLASGRGDGSASVSTWSFAAGIALFSGSLYAMALGAPTWLGAVTPLGGLTFLAGWLFLLKRDRAH